MIDFALMRRASGWILAATFAPPVVTATFAAQAAVPPAPAAAAAAAPAQQTPSVASGVNTNAVPMITGPLIARPPQYARWIVRSEWAEAKLDPAAAKSRPASPRGPKLTEYMKGPNVGRQITTWSTGQQSTIWYYNRIMMEKLPTTEPILLKEIPGPDEELVGGAIPANMLQSYSDFDWLRPEFFAGEEEKNGLRCLHFKEVVPTVEFEVKLSAEDVDHYNEMDRLAIEAAAAAGENKKPKLVPRSAPDRLIQKRIGYEREAWVTVEGRWPVATRLGQVMYVYQHLEPPVAGAFPRMPPEFHNMLVEYCQAWNLPAPKY